MMQRNATKSVGVCCTQRCPNLQAIKSQDSRGITQGYPGGLTSVEHLLGYSSVFYLTFNILLY